MRRRTRMLLVGFAIVVIALSLIALAYAVSPVQTHNERLPIAPTLLMIPTGEAP